MSATDQAYAERNQLVRFLCCHFPCGIKRTAIEGWDPEWQNCVYVETPCGQLSWHYHDREKELFSDLPPFAGEWDGHTSQQKYERLQKLIAIADLQAPAPI
jgi:hypothetical protein